VQLLARGSAVAPSVCPCPCPLSDIRSLCAPSDRGLSSNVPLTSCADRLCAHSRRQPRLSSRRSGRAEVLRRRRHAPAHPEALGRGHVEGVLGRWGGGSNAELVREPRHLGCRQNRKGEYRQGGCCCRLAFTRYCFSLKLYGGSLSSFCCPPPAPKPTLLHDHCAIYDSSPTPL